MSDGNLLNSVGLIFDIVGVVIVWRYGLPGLLTDEGEMITTGKEDEIAKAKCYKRISRWGMGSLVLGFSLQLISNFL